MTTDPPMQVPEPAAADERLGSLLSVTASGVALLDLHDLLVELLDRVRHVLEADTAAVLLLDPTSQSLVATAARGLEEEVHQGVRVPVGRGFAGRIAATRQPVLLDRVDETTVANPILWEKGIRTMLGVPLSGAGRLLGVLHVGRLEQLAFSDDDVPLLEAAAERVGSAVLSSRLAAEETAATILELSLMPTVLPQPPGLAIATRYVTAERGVGGDWYDAFTGPSGELWVVVGDVAGHGLAAAVVMGRVKSSLRSYALLGGSPARTLELTDRKVHHFEVGAMVTLACAVARPPYEEFVLSCAGHPPPMTASPDGSATVVDVRPDPPLGVVEGWGRHDVVVPVPEGGVLLLYTDGLVERHDQDLDTGLDRLRAAVRAEEPEVICRTVMHELVGSDVPSDDIAVLAVRRLPAGARSGASPSGAGAPGPAAARPGGGGACGRPGARTVRSFSSDPGGVASARHFALEATRGLPVDHAAVALLVTELASNAVRHARSAYTVEIEEERSGLRVEVTDEGDGMPVLQTRSVSRPSGRGLLLVDAVARSWGVRTRAAGKTVWAEVSA